MKLPGYIKTLLEGVLGLLTRTETTLAEFNSSTALIVLGILLALPGDALVNAPLFLSMRSYMSEGTWAVVFLGLGVFQAIANITRDARARGMAAFMAAVFFLFIGALGATVTPVSMFGAVCKVFSLVQAIVYLKLKLGGYHK